MTESNDIQPHTSSIDDLLARTSNWIADRTSVDDDVRDALEHVAQNNTAKLNLLQHVLAMKKASLLAQLHTVQDAIVSQLLDPDQIRKIKDPQLLIKLGNLARELLRDGESYIERRCEQGVDPAVPMMLDRMKLEGNQSELAEKIKAMPPQKRELMRKVFAPLRESGFPRQNQVAPETSIEADKLDVADDSDRKSDLKTDDHEQIDPHRNGIAR